MKTKVVCFDLGGVLVDVCHTWEQVWSVLGERPKTLIEGPLTRFEPLNDFQAARIDASTYLASLARATGMDEPFAARVHLAILRDEFPGVGDLKREIEDNGLATGCLSNTNGLHWPYLIDSTRFPTIAGLRHKVASHVVGADKPHPEIYRAFEDVSGARPNEIVFFDDVQDYVKAAIERGWRAFTVIRNRDTADQMRDHLHQESVL